ncbi:MAG: response regulator [Phycisphaerae bacterium]|nr:response regulator [Phycisphaerae bacterium]
MTTEERFGPNDVLTTGQVAKICNVAPRTVSKWFDTGQLRGYRIPGSKDRRIPVQHLVRFMRAHGIPLGQLDSGQTRVLLIDDDPELLGLLGEALKRTERYGVRTAGGSFEAGAIAQEFRPHVILVDVTLPDVDAGRISRFLLGHGELQATKLIGTSGALTDGEIETLRQEGFDSCLRKPFDIHQVISAIEQAVAIVY